MCKNHTKVSIQTWDELAILDSWCIFACNFEQLFAAYLPVMTKQYAPPASSETGNSNFVEPSFVGLYLDFVSSILTI